LEKAHVLGKPQLRKYEEFVQAVDLEDIGSVKHDIIDVIRI
jgi:hypothetical protein